MTVRRGVLSAGTWCVDFNKAIRSWPSEDTSSEVLEVERQGGGAGYNMALDLKRLDPEFPVEAMGVVGDDDLGRFLYARCDERGVERSGLVALANGATMSVDAFNVRDSGRRTHFYRQGVAGEMTPEHFDFSRSKARYLHLGLPGAHKAMDRPWRDEANGWVAVLKAARAVGLMANLELMTTASHRIAELGRPCLPHVDFLIVNDFEIGALVDQSTRRPDGKTAPRAVRAAIDEVLEQGSPQIVIVHFPGGAVAGARGGGTAALGSVAMPQAKIAGVNGAGDAFAAGALYGLHEGWSLERALSLGHAAAAASMQRLSTTEGVGTVSDCLALAGRWGFRPAPAI